MESCAELPMEAQVVAPHGTSRLALALAERAVVVHFPPVALASQRMRRGARVPSADQAVASPFWPGSRCRSGRRAAHLKQR